MQASQQVYDSKKNKGFTIVEILIVLIIVGVLSAIILPMAGAFIEKSKETTCIGNRKTIEKAYNLYRTGQSNPVTLTQFISDGATNSAEWADHMGKCPSGGIYTVSSDASGTKDIIVCSVHDKTETPAPTPTPGNIIPGTDKYGGSSGIPATDNWDACVTEHNIAFTEGQKFLYNGKFYVATETLPNIYYETNSDPSQNVWWTTKSAGGLVQVTDVSQTWDNVLNGDTFKRGDLLYYNGNYYVCMVDGNGGVFTVTKGQYYSSTPENRADAWYKLVP